MIEIIFPNQTPAIFLPEFMVLILCEIALFWFFMPKQSLRQISPMIVAINLIKVGAFSLITPVFHPYSFYYNPLIEITILIVIGTIFSTIVYEREQVELSRNQASSIAFRVTSLSTFSYISLKYYDFQPSYILLDSSGWRLPESMASIQQPFLVPNILLLIGLVIGLLMIFFRYNKKNLTTSSSIP
ncbi:MAG: hypothetical protein ACFFB5_09515 [Promethearchaeota archaeon]